MKNITLKLDERLIRRARHIAVDRNQSVSAWVAGLIQETVHSLDREKRSRTEALRILDRGFRLSGKPEHRDRLHER